MRQPGRFHLLVSIAFSDHIGKNVFEICLAFGIINISLVTINKLRDKIEVVTKAKIRGCRVIEVLSFASKKRRHFASVLERKFVHHFYLK